MSSSSSDNDWALSRASFRLLPRETSCPVSVSSLRAAPRAVALAARGSFETGSNGAHGGLGAAGAGAAGSGGGGGLVNGGGGGGGTDPGGGGGGRDTGGVGSCSSCSSGPTVSFHPSSRLVSSDLSVFLPASTLYTIKRIIIKASYGIRLMWLYVSMFSLRDSCSFFY